MPASRDSQDDHNHEKQKWEGGKKDFSCPGAEKDCTLPPRRTLSVQIVQDNETKRKKTAPMNIKVTIAFRE